MTLSSATVAPLTRVTLRIDPSTSATPKTVAFIFGIGPNGLTPFENKLSGKAVGESVAISVAGEETGHLFEHLAPEFRAMPKNAGMVDFQVSVVAVEEPNPREVISAISALVSDCGGGCGCGCGGNH